MRVSNSMGYEQVKGNIQKNRSEAADLQNQAATMKRITKPSDDPVGTARALALKTDNTNATQFMKNHEMARNFLNYTETALSDLTEAVSRAKELAIGQASDASANAETRMAVASEIDQLFKDVVGISNRRIGDRYIFGGYKTTHTPFTHDGHYRGDQGAMQIEVAPGVFTSMNLPGDRVFLGRDNSLANVPEGRRGATTPNYAPAPSQPEDVQVRGPASVDEDDEQSRNTERHDTEKAVRGPASVQEEESLTRKKKHLNDDEEITQVKEGPKGENIFNVFKSLSNGLRANDTVAIQDTLDRLDAALEQAILLRSQVGSRISSLEQTHESLGKNKIDNSALLSSVEDADAFEVFSDITKNENTLKATLQTSGKLIQPSLLDFLR